jgi:hypothetical protein
MAALTARRRPVQQVTGIVEADASAVWDALLAVVRPADAIIKADPERMILSVSGHWWFLGEYTVSHDDRGSLLTYSMFNAAPPLTKWLVPLVAGNALHASARPMVERQVAAIGSELGVRGYLIP